jgi:hypothetical protein
MHMPNLRVSKAMKFQCWIESDGTSGSRACRNNFDSSSADRRVSRPTSRKCFEVESVEMKPTVDSRAGNQNLNLCSKCLGRLQYFVNLARGGFGDQGAPTSIKDDRHSLSWQ